jgi:hypothetical protein
MTGVALDDAVRAIADALRLWINGGPDCWLELFTNDIGLSPGHVNPNLYSRPHYPGYTPLGILGLFGPPVRVQAGQWYTQAPPQQFGDNGGAATVELWGWTLRRGSKIVYGQQLDAVLLLAGGRPGPLIVPRLTAGSRSVLCPGP